MPRQSRIVLPNCPHHIIQRGHNRQVVFSSDDDYLYYIQNLQEWKTELRCKVYSYCLMTNHVHLVVDPCDDVGALGRLMKRIGGRQTRYVNKLKGRTGTLWEGRFKSSPIQANQYLLACCRYVELNPVRARMVEFPWDYPWSSCSVKTGTKKQIWLDNDPFYTSLGRTRKRREEVYRDWLLESLSEPELKLIREAVQRGQLTGNDKFSDSVSDKIGRGVELRGPGRPKKGTK